MSRAKALYTGVPFLLTLTENFSYPGNFPRLRQEEGLSVMKRTDLTLEDVYHAGRADRISRD